MRVIAEIKPNDRILLRDRPWIVRRVNAISEECKLVEIESLDGDHPDRLSVAIPPEEVQLLPTEAVGFNLSDLDSLPSWSQAHRILASTFVRETGLLCGARFGRVALEAYQFAPTLRLLSKPRPSLLIADDVGLGKTIEAGLAILELMARGRVRRILIVTPPGLMEQWGQEMQNKFGLEFRIIGNTSDLAQVQSELPAGTSAWEVLPRVITSVDYIKKETVVNRVLRKRWDLVIVDEAHALAESGTPQNPYHTRRTRLGVKLRDACRGLLLLTATPHNGYAHTFRSLLELVEPTLATFHGSARDVERRIEAARVRRMKSQIRRQLPDGREEPVFPQRKVYGVPVHLTDPQDKELLVRVASYCSSTVRQVAGSEDEELIGFAMQIIKKRSLSSRNALAITLENRLEALQKEDAREEKPTTADLRDYQADLPMTETQGERIARRILRSAIPPDERCRAAEVKALNNIRRLLEKLSDKDPKIEKLVSEVKHAIAGDPSEKVIVFTEYRDTLDAICKRLDTDHELAERYVILHGGLTRRQRLDREERFAHPDVRVLLATDAASEGLNLQHYCRRIIHMELPWNPNRLEQRNGRVDRYGQTREPIISYLFYPDSPEDDVLARLVEKIEQMAKDRISTPDILGVLSGRSKIQEGLVRLDPEDKHLEEQKLRLIHSFEDRTAEFVRDLQPLLAAGQNSEEDLHRLLQLLNTKETLIPDDRELEQIVLNILGHSVIPDQEQEGIYRIEVPWSYRGDRVQAVYPAVTFRRSVAVRYRADQVEYITPLHPLIQALAADARRRLLQVYPNVRGLPPRRLAARTVASNEPVSAVFTWLGSICGGGGLLEENMIAIRVDLDGNVMGSPEENLRWLRDDSEAGDVPRVTLERLYKDHFTTMRTRAESAASCWLKERAADIREHRRRQAELLRQDLDRDVSDRLREIEEEEKYARGLVERTGQLRMFSDSEVSRRGFDTRRSAVETYRRQRLAEIEEYELVKEPASPRPLGALFLVPEGEAA